MKKRIAALLLLSVMLLELCACAAKPSQSSQELSAASSADVSSAAALSELAEEAASEEQSVETGLTITAFSVGKADALLVEEDDSTLLIDAGEAEDGDFLLSELSARGITSLDALLITHFDKDHVGAAAQLAGALTIDTILYPDYTGDRKEYEAFMAAISGHAGARAVTDTETLMLGGAELTIYPAENAEEILQQEDEFDNDLSLVTRLQYGSRSFLFCGDAQALRLSQMLTSGTDWSCDWLKVPHHGRYEKMLKSFLKASSPAYAVITDSAEELIEDKTISQLEKLGIAWYDTAQYTIITTCDGDTITVTPVEAEKEA